MGTRGRPNGAVSKPVGGNRAAALPARRAAVCGRLAAGCRQVPARPLSAARGSPGPSRGAAPWGPWLGARRPLGGAPGAQRGHRRRLSARSPAALAAAGGGRSGTRLPQRGPRGAGRGAAAVAGFFRPLIALRSSSLVGRGDGAKHMRGSALSAKFLSVSFAAVPLYDALTFRLPLPSSCWAIL